MGGRIHGFLGGVLLTASITYYNGYQFKQTQKLISQSLRESKTLIDERNKPVESASKSLEFSYRPSVWETVADIWNDEVIRGVNWVYSVNWAKLTTDVEDKISNAINKN
ncbi:hypothetical protein BABINDRAFT_57276 [Babjeviella inositovora NRRL Y-12698]|uniref:MICOS complex subunit MIC12 n=1 Tax=Babjeviella inositovora NRRL Y-12698 TaxID=984486 RepID=A0A1E3R129_9ASCO|nr:uncharacterized protein BABINDRAFT_57276 [Babjeviella inositovora NRRL Y-12698]ODQ83052.1 hypothetical protein BABINDRAFT_57276 [Babjeviella inositovora NRRL Y-12698]